MRKYDIIYSIGTSCLCASYLKKHRLRITSGPFDWLMGAGFTERSDMIVSEFSDFLRITDLEFVEKRSGRPDDQRCDFYKNTATGMLFLHDFPIREPLEKSIGSVQSKYSRRIKRFYKNIQEADKALLVWVNIDGVTNKEAILDGCAQICKKTGKAVDFLLIEYDENLKHGEAHVEELADNIMLHRLFMRFTWENGELVAIEGGDECDAIFSGYGLNLTVEKKIKIHLLHIGVRVLCFFIPIKKWRKRLRGVAKERIRLILV